MLKLRAVSEANMPKVNTSFEALHPIQRVLKLYEQLEAKNKTLTSSPLTSFPSRVFVFRATLRDMNVWNSYI